MNLQSKILILLLFFTTITFSQTQNIDVQQYTNNISVTDSNDTIVGISEIEILFTKTVNSFFLDLINTNADGKGMIVSKVLENGETVEFSHIKDKININTSKLENETSTYSVYYSGVPADGLIISQNKYGERTFFADNWPKRARNWFPCVDHPIDKARVIFKVTAPSNYQVIANGTLVEETDLSNENTFYKWKTNVSISTKIMVIGIAKFAVEHLGNTKDIPISSWVYPQNKEDGFYDYAQAQKVLSFFIDNVGPYPFEKLANVQSKTKYGGMENAGNIFYSEASVTGKRDQEDLFAHEIAHQWFGDSASETDWEHLWLSEGFATYFTNLYLEKTYGVDSSKNRLEMQRHNTIGFAKQNYSPLVNLENPDPEINYTNAYEKGSWVLHMLRKKVGDELFWESIRTYYNTYKFSNASTEDLRQVFESVTKQDLRAFFNQWLFTAGHPELAFEPTVSENKLNLIISQKQKAEHTFAFPIDVNLIYSNDSEEIKTLEVTQREQSFSLPLKAELKEVIIDPDTWLLFEYYNKQ